VKINAVVVHGENDDQLAELLLFATARGVEIRFIEVMSMGPLAEHWRKRYVPASEMRWRLRSVVSDWTCVERSRDAATPMIAHLRSGGRAAVGFITAMSCPFCDGCDRLRIASDGT
jgi:cyclic pyranopterin phosphate synthase